MYEVNKMFISIDKSKHKKGQGIVEYALLLAFIVGLAVMLQGVGLAGAVKDTFDSVASLLGGEKKGYAWALENLSGLSKDEIRKKASEEERIKMDQEALANLGKAFIGMKKTDVNKILKNPNDSTGLTGKGFWLANYHDPDADNAEAFTTDFNYNDDAQTKYNSQFERQFADVTPFLNGTNINADKPLITDIANGVQVDTSTNSRSFFSEYMIDNSSGDNTDRSIRLNLHYDSDGVVDGARVRVNVGRTDKGGDKLSYSADHDVTVNKDKKYQKTIDKTGIITVSESWSYNNSCYNNLDF